jgi:hypothetical protein
MSKLSPINTMMGRAPLQTSSLLQKYSQNQNNDVQMKDEEQVSEDKINQIIIS